MNEQTKMRQDFDVDKLGTIILKKQEWSVFFRCGGRSEQIQKILKPKNLIVL